MKIIKEVQVSFLACQKKFKKYSGIWITNTMLHIVIYNMQNKYFINTYWTPARIPNLNGKDLPHCVVSASAFP